MLSCQRRGCLFFFLAFFCCQKKKKKSLWAGREGLTTQAFYASGTSLEAHALLGYARKLKKRFQIKTHWYGRAIEHARTSWRTGKEQERVGGIWFLWLWKRKQRKKKKKSQARLFKRHYFNNTPLPSLGRGLAKTRNEVTDEEKKIFFL